MYKQHILNLLCNFTPVSTDSLNPKAEYEDYTSIYRSIFKQLCI